MIRLSMEKRYKIGTTFNICLVILFGLFAIYHLHSLSLTIQNQLESEVQKIIISENLSIELQQLVQNFFSPDSVKITDLEDHNEKINRLARAFSPVHEKFTTLIGRESKLSLDIKIRLEKAASPPDRESAAKQQAILLEFLTRLQKDLVVIRDRNLSGFYQQKLGLAAISKAFQSRIAVVTIIFAVCAFIAVFFLAHQIRLPIHKIISIIRRIRDGDYAIPARKETASEIDQIISGLSSMAENLKIRDQLRIDKILLEKKRFATLANFLNVPVFMVNEEGQIAFANDELMNLFRLSLDDLYEVNFTASPLPIELKEKLKHLINEKKWLENEPFIIIGENYSYDLHLSLIPVKTADNSCVSVIVTLGKIDCRKKTARS